MAFCTNCGTKLAEGQRFCCNCGTMVAGVTPEASPIPQAPIYSTPVTDPIPEVPVPPEPEAPVCVEPEVPVHAEPEVPVHSEPETPCEPAAIPEPPAPAVPVTTQDAAPRKAVMDADSFVFAPEASTSYDSLTLKFEEIAEEESDEDSESAEDTEAPVTAEAPAAPQVSEPADKGKKSSRPRRKFLPAFCSVLICILLVLMMLPTFTLLTARNALKQETLLATLDRIDIDELPASFIDESDRELKRLSLSAYICKIINSDMNNLNNIVFTYYWEDLTPKTLNRFLEDTTFLEFFAEHAEGVIDAVLSGDESYTVSARAIKNLLEENKDPIIEKMNISISDSNYELFVDFLVSDGLNTRIPLPVLEEGILDLINFGLSYYAIGALCLVMVLLVVLLFLTNRKDRLFAVKDTGVALVIGSLLFLLVTLAARILCSIFVDEDPLMYLLSTLVSCAAESILLIVLSVLAVGVILLLVNLIVRKVQSKRAARAAV